MISPRRSGGSRRRAANSSSISVTSGTATSSESSRTRTASCSTSRSTAGSEPTDARSRRSTRPRAGLRTRSGTAEKLLDELIGIEFLDRRLLLDDAFREVEVLQLGQPLDIDLAEILLPDIDELGV